MEDFKNDTYIIINKSDLSSVDFSEVKQNSVYTSRYSLLDDMVILSYSSIPEFIAIGKIKPIKYLTWSEALVEMDSDIWSDNSLEEDE